MTRRGGWRRLGRKPRFRYQDARGRPITDEQALERIGALAIPPAWREVWISPNARAKLQATGVDSTGRRQYLYHASYRAAQEARKFDRLVRFGELLPSLRARMTEHLELGPYEQEWAAAVALSLVNRAWFRVGSERYARRTRRTRTYGVTTLRKRHVRVRGQRVTFEFRGKHRILVRSTIVDPDLASAVATLLDLPGDTRLFRFERNGSRPLLTAQLLNAYLAEHLDPGFTAKDFRTWGGTLTAAMALAEHGPPATAADERRVLAAVMRRVGDELGNTASVARSSYVSPAVVELWREGRTIDGEYQRRRPRIVRSRVTELLPEEAALLALLRSSRAGRKRAAA